ncbi:MAG: 8-oxoguanine DNA glycosylase [Chloroflexi bacterium]|nr:8-oxoguanine DNA glycosylase [Chloroflexota bacterium]
MSERFELPFDGPLDLPTTLASGQCFRWRADDAGAWTGVIGTDIVRLARTPQGVAIESAPTPPAELAERIAAYLRLDDDLPAIQARIGSDERIAEGIERYPGMRIMRQEPWETLAAFILSSTSNIPRIARTVELIADTFGDPLSLDATTRNTFPAPETLAEAGEARLRELGCGFRAPYLAQAAAAVADGTLPLGKLRGASYADVLAALTALHGVGDKIADCAMLFSLERMEAFPADRWIRRALVDWYGLPANVSYDGTRSWAQERFGSDAGYANQYLFWNVREASRKRVA